MSTQHIKVQSVAADFNSHYRRVLKDTGSASDSLCLLQFSVVDERKGGGGGNFSLNNNLSELTVL